MPKLFASGWRPRSFAQGGLRASAPRRAAGRSSGVNWPSLRAADGVAPIAVPPSCAPGLAARPLSPPRGGPVFLHTADSVCPTHAHEGGAGQGRVRSSRTTPAPLLEVNDSAVEVLGEPTFKQIAHELAAAVRSSVAINWTAKESVRARIRILLKRILRQHGFPPDEQEVATATVLAQAELLCGDWAA